MVTPVSSDDVRFAICEETVPGQTPDDPVFYLLPVINSQLGTTDNARSSNVRGGDGRAPRDTLLLGREVTGQTTFGLIHAPGMDFILESALAGGFGYDPRGCSIGADEMYEASRQKTFTVEVRWQIDGTPTYRYHRFTGCQVNTATIGATPNDEVTLTVDFLGQRAATAAAEIAGASYVDYGAAPVMTVPDVYMVITDPDGPTKLVETGEGLDIVTGIQLAIPNNLRGIEAVGVLGKGGTVLGRFEPTIQFTSWYKNDDVLEAGIARTELAAQLVYTDSDGASYTFDFGRCKFQSAPYPPIAEGDATVQVTLQPLRANTPGALYACKVTRTPHS